jgi:hypothetical protein
MSSCQGRLEALSRAESIALGASGLGQAVAGQYPRVRVVSTASAQLGLSPRRTVGSEFRLALSARPV